MFHSVGVNYITLPRAVVPRPPIPSLVSGLSLAGRRCGLQRQAPAVARDQTGGAQ